MLGKVQEYVLMFIEGITKLVFASCNCTLWWNWFLWGVKLSVANFTNEGNVIHNQGLERPNFFRPIHLLGLSYDVRAWSNHFSAPHAFFSI